MKILVMTSGAVLIHFHPKELRFALGVLQALYQHTQLTFIEEAIKDIEDRLRQPQIPFTPTHRLCETCCCEIDLKTGNYAEINGVYQHIQCPPLKDKRPD